MTQAAWAAPRTAPAARARAWRVAGLAASALIVLVYSQAWVFPLIGEQASADQGGLVRALFMPAYAAAFLLLAMAPRRTLAAAIRQPFLIALMAVVGLSVLWSIAPDQTLRRTVAVYCTTLGALVVAARYRWNELSELVAGCFAALVVVALVTSLALPSVGRMHELFPGAWRGVWPEKNALGGNMAIGFVILVAAAALNPRRAKIWLPFAALALGLVVMSTSKTSLVALLLGLGAMGFVAVARRGPAAGVATTWLAALGVAALAGVALFAADLVFDILGKDATLTGRTKIWDAAMRQIEQRPWTGFGYDAVWGEKGVWSPYAWIVRDAGFTPQHAHNSWIEQWLGLGVFGLTAFGLMYLQTVALAVVAVFRERGAYLAVPFLVVYSLMTLTESIAVTYHDLRWVLFVIMAAKLALPDRDEAAPYRGARRA